MVGGQDLFLRKFSNTDNVRYTRQFGTSTAEEAYGIAVLDASTLFIAGSTQGAFVGDNRGSWDAFASRLNGNGTVIWTDQ